MPSLFGFLNVDKPTGWTSRRVVDHVQRMIRPVKVGHAGTLDPLATGVLVVCVGQATRLVPCLHELPKQYRAEFLLGRTSTTDDIEGEITEVPGVIQPSSDEIQGVLPEFLGEIRQVPPAFSAAKVRGQRAYRLARQGESPELNARTVQIDALSLVDFSPPKLVLDVTCRSGTYIRSLGRDLGQRLQCGALMSGLIRTRIGPFRIEDSLRPEDISVANLSERLIPPLDGLPHLQRVIADAAACRRIRQGQRVDLADDREIPCDESIALIDPDDRLSAIVIRPAGTRQLAPRLVFTDQQPSE